VAERGNPRARGFGRAAVLGSSPQGRSRRRQLAARIDAERARAQL
jgi:hypothetical protein